MKPSVVAAAVFAASCVAFGAWLLSRPRPAEEDGPGVAGPNLAAFTFAAWSARSDGVLLVLVEPKGSRFVPKQFHVVDVMPGDGGHLTTADGAFFSWGHEERAQSTMVLLDRGFPVSNDDYEPYPPVLDPLVGDASAGADGGVEQILVLRSRGGLVAVLRRRRDAPAATLVWGRRATGFPSRDDKLAYVIPDKVIVPIGSAPPAPSGSEGATP